MNRTVDRPLQQNPQNVFAIDREIMARRNASPRSQRKLFAQTLGLPQLRPFIRIVLERRCSVRSPGEPSDHRWRAVEIFAAAVRYRSRSAGTTVSASAFVSNPCDCSSGGRIIVPSISTLEQITDGIGIFRAIQPMEIGGPTRIRPRGCGTIELGLEPRRGGIVRRVVGSPDAWRRHRPRA